jgi:hypothetical protein
VALNRRNIYLRDRYECAFCLTRLRAVDLSLDHVYVETSYLSVFCVSVGYVYVRACV